MARLANLLPVVSLVCAGLLAGPAAAQDDLSFDPGPAERCMAAAGGNAQAMQACIGQAADGCMQQSDMAQTTYGMGFCFDQELRYWDGRLNAAYQQVRARDKAIDAEMEQLGSAAPRLAPAVRDMQRAWITFRDASCDYERAQWGNGTGGGPAALLCMMRLTGQQALVLESRLRNGYN